MQNFKKFIFNKLLKIHILKYSSFQKLLTASHNLELRNKQMAQLSLVPPSLSFEFFKLYSTYYHDIKSQLLQELFVLTTLKSKEGGFFVEAGASDGLDCSNTFLLEKHFKWDGILIEPSLSAIKKISLNRKAKVVPRALFSESNLKLEFLEDRSSGLSSLKNFGNQDILGLKRKIFAKYSVKTLSLSDVLSSSGAPEVIDYLSLDTEGSEFEILRTFDFKKYIFLVITVEHAYTDQGAMIHELLEKNSYVRVLKELSDFDYWYIHNSIL